MKCEIYPAKDGWRWRIRARNGRIVADGAEAYKRSRDILRVLDRILDDAVEIKWLDK